MSYRLFCILIIFTMVVFVLNHSKCSLGHGHPVFPPKFVESHDSSDMISPTVFIFVIFFSLGFEIVFIVDFL